MKAWIDLIFGMYVYHIEYKKPNVLGGGQRSFRGQFMYLFENSQKASPLTNSNKYSMKFGHGNRLVLGSDMMFKYVFIWDYLNVSLITYNIVIDHVNTFR